MSIEARVFVCIWKHKIFFACIWGAKEKERERRKQKAMRGEGLLDIRATGGVCFVLSVIRYIHGTHGRVFGGVVRALFLRTGEDISRIDCVFLNRDGAENLLRMLGVEHMVAFGGCLSHGLNVYSVKEKARERPPFEGTTVNLHVHAYYTGLTRRMTLPGHAATPALDIDCLAWAPQGLAHVLPLRISRRIQGCPLQHCINRIVQKRFCVVNGLSPVSPTAAITVYESAMNAVLRGYTQDDMFATLMPHPRPCLVTRRSDNEDSLGFRLPCAHVVSSETMYTILRTGQRAQHARAGEMEGLNPLSTGCPICGEVVIRHTPL